MEIVERIAVVLEVKATESAGKIILTGNTYPAKEAIKAMGGKWNASAKRWEVSAKSKKIAKVLNEVEENQKEVARWEAKREEIMEAVIKKIGGRAVKDEYRLYFYGVTIDEKSAQKIAYETARELDPECGMAKAPEIRIMKGEK